MCKIHKNMHNFLLLLSCIGEYLLETTRAAEIKAKAKE